MPARTCHDHHRTRVHHAQAGRGLPAIEPGMPMPAGTGMGRRAFLLRSAGVGLSVYSAGKLLGAAAMDEGIAHAAAAAPAPVIVNVFCDGGIDNLSLLAPVGDPLYAKLRPKLAVADSDARLSEDPRLVWHPSAAALATLHAEGKLCVAPAIGYADADQSHFTSRHYYEVGAATTKLQTGWLGRWIDTVGAVDNPIQGLSLDGSLSPTLAGTKMPVAAVSAGDDYRLWSRGVWGNIESRMMQAVSQIGGSHASSRDAALQQTASAAANVMRLSAQLAPFAPADDAPFVPPVPYPEDAREGFPRRLADLARLLAAGLPIRAVAVRAAGTYDTHEDQLTSFPKDLKLASDTLLAFQRDLESRGLADRVVTLIWSEFGRRGEENGSGGSDHGAGGAAFVMGSRVTGTMIGEFPGLAALDEDGNVPATSDFRGLYCSILEQWLGADAAAIIPDAGQFARPTIIR